MLQVGAEAKMSKREFESRVADITANDSDGKEHSKEAREIGSAEFLKSSFIKKFKKVVTSSDANPEVLYARGPTECRRYATENQLFAATGCTKSIILVLNKVAIVPKQVTNKLLIYLCKDFPAVVLCASVPELRDKGSAKMSGLAASSPTYRNFLVHGTYCLCSKTTLETIISKYPLLLAL